VAGVQGGAGEGEGDGQVAERLSFSACFQASS